MASGRLKLEPLISRRISFDDAPSAYDVLTADKSILGVLLTYPTGDAGELPSRSVSLAATPPAFDTERPICGFIGAGNYAARVLIPAFRKAGAQLHTIVAAGGSSSAIQGRQAGFAHAGTDVEAIYGDGQINTLVVATRHDSHADLVTRGLMAGKNVFVEKPLALTLEQVEAIEAAYATATVGSRQPRLMVGFNRRFAPHVVKMRQLLASVKEPKAFIMTMNAGAIPPDHWTQSREAGGGRIIGEACHLIDLMRFLAGSPIVSVQARRMGDSPGMAISEDKAVIVLGFADGSFGTVNYLANGAKSFPKERIEAFCAGRVLQLDNFRRLTGYGWPGFRKLGGWSQDKGQNACAAAFLAAIVDGKASPIPAEEIFEVARASVDAARLLRGQA